MYKEAGNKTKIHKELDDLNINIIYIKNNQKYFTYNPYSGDCMNTIKDPIVTVYTENIDNSNLIENDISIFSILHTYVLQEKLLFNAYMFRLYIKSLLNHCELSNKNISRLLHTRLEYSNLNF